MRYLWTTGKCSCSGQASRPSLPTHVEVTAEMGGAT